MATKSTVAWWPWLFFLGEPSDSDLEYLFLNEIGAYVLSEFAVCGEC